MAPVRWAWLILACALASLIATPATVLAADAVFSLHLVGITASVSVQLAHDFAVLLLLLLCSLVTGPAHRLPHLLFIAIGALLLSVGEPVFSARTDIVWSAWQLPRIVGRLSAGLFVLTLASYADVVAERPRGWLRVALRMSIGALLLGSAWGFSLMGRRGFAALALLLGIDARWEDEPPHAFNAAPGSLFARIALLAAWPHTLAFPSPWRAEVLSTGGMPDAVVTVKASHGAWLPGRYSICGRRGD